MRSSGFVALLFLTLALASDERQTRPDPWWEELKPVSIEGHYGSPVKRFSDLYNYLADYQQRMGNQPEKRVNDLYNYLAWLQEQQMPYQKRFNFERVYPDELGNQQSSDDKKKKRTV